MPNLPKTLVPADTEAEMSVVASALLDADAVNRVSWLKAEWFHDEKMRYAWQAILSLRERGVPPDFLTVRAELEHGDYKVAATPGELTNLLNVVPTSIHAEHYAGIVRELWKRRALIAAGSDIVALAYDAPDAGRAIVQALKVVQSVDAGDADLRSVGVEQAVGDTIELLATAGIRGISTGLADLDRVLGGFKPGKLYIPVGEPRVGKTVTACNFALAAVRQKQRVAWWSGEMSHEEMVVRLAANLAGVDSWKIEQGTLSETPGPDGESERGRFFAALHWLTENAQIDFLRKGCPDVHSFADAVYRKHRVAPYGLVIVDYMQRMVRGVENKPALVGEVSGVLKDLAQDCNVPVIGYSQPSREVQKRENRRLALGDLYYSGQLEQDADVVIGLYREGFWLTPQPIQGEMELAVLKHRGGPTDMAKAYYHLPTLKLGNLAKGAM